MRNLAIDLGSSTTIVCAPGRGIVLEQPTVIAVNERTGKVLTMGEEAWRTVAAEGGNVVAVRPIRGGAIVDFELTERLLALVLARAGAGRFIHPRVLIAVSSTATPVERRAIEEAALSAGARSAALINEPLAAALGADLPIEEPIGNCIVSVGGGTTEVAIISLGGVVAWCAVRVGGIDFDEAIRAFLRREYGVAIGERTAEVLKREVGSAFPQDEEPKAEIRGRELSTGTPKVFTVGAEEIRGALDDAVLQVVGAVRAALADAPPELAHDVIERGIVLTGGGSQLRGLDARLRAETSIPVALTDSPQQTVARGAARAMQGLDLLKEHGILPS